MNDIKTIKNLLVGVFLILAFGAVYFARDMFLPIVIGMFVALTLSPIVRWLSRIGVPAAMSSVILIFGAAIMVSLGAYVLSGPITTILADAPQIGVELRNKLGGLLESLESVKTASEQVEDIANSGDSTPTVAVEQPSLLAFAAGSIASFMSLTAVGLVLALFILASGDLIYVKLVDAAPSFADKRKSVTTMRAVERQVSRYFLTITAINATLGISITVGMMVVGLPNPVLWGILGFALNFLPFIGALAGVLAVAAFGILTFDTIGAGLVPAAIYFTLTSIEGHFVTPNILGRRLELNTVSVILTVVIWSWLWSIPGALMAVPFLVILKVVGENVDGMKVFAGFLGDRSSNGTSKSGE